MLEEEVSLMTEQTPAETRILRETPAEHFSNGGGSHATKVLIDERRHPYCCAFPMKRLTPFVYLCGSCGNLVAEHFFPNGESEFHVSNIGKPLFSLKVPIEQHVKHDITLKPARTRKKTWLEKEGKKTVQVEEEEAIEETLHGSSERKG